MSDHWIGIIPREADFVPSAEAVAVAEAYFAEIAPEAEDVVSEVAGAVRFRDCGGNFESIRCPVCDADVSIDWWSDQLDDEDSWVGDFGNKPLRLPCGHTAKSLNDLRYRFEQGFSRIILNAMNPYIGELKPEQVRRFEEILGCPVKVINRHI